ncbi:type II toxin-antitoxin system HicB family antitoxin [Eionea flava]
MSLIKYKGYLGTVEYSQEDQCLYGKVAYIRDLVNYEAESATGLEAAFQEAVDSYLDECEKLGKAPNIPFKGSFNVRTGPDLHRAAVVHAKEQSLNAFVCEAIKEKIERSQRE